jgi:hypothetical protein
MSRDSLLLIIGEGSAFLDYGIRYLLYYKAYKYVMKAIILVLI